MNTSDIKKKERFKKVNPKNNQGKITCNILNQSSGVKDSHSITDYGNYHHQSESFYLFEPSSIEEAISGLEEAKKRGLKIRTRGAGHSMHGRSNPRKDELLILTKNLNSCNYRAGENYITVGSGVQVWSLDQLLRKEGSMLPVVHDGEAPASTVGGFILAGGFGTASRINGGFWNHIQSMKIWQPQQGLLDIKKEDELFNKIVAASETKSIVLSANLSTGKQMTRTINTNIPWEERIHDSLIWFTFICQKKHNRILRSKLIELDKELSNYWKPRDIYYYPIKSIGKTPHNFYPYGNNDLIAAGVWGEKSDQTLKYTVEILLKVNKTCSQIPFCVRYWQSEL